jgi:hypothetical protein
VTIPSNSISTFEELSDMSEIIILYFLIGAFLAFRHISSGRVGEIGKVGTFLSHMLLWPLFTVMK